MNNILKVKGLLSNVVLFIVMFFVFMVVADKNMQAIGSIEEKMGEVKLLDTRFFYDADTVYNVLENLGETGRNYYRELLLKTELIFPLVYRFFIIVTLCFLFRWWVDKKSSWNLICFIPLVDLLFDYMENFIVLIMLKQYPDLSVVLATLVGYITMIKYIFVYFAWFLILFSIVMIIGKLIFGLVNRLRERVVRG